MDLFYVHLKTQSLTDDHHVQNMNFLASLRFCTWNTSKAKKMINVSAHTFISRYTPNKEYSHAPSKRRFLQFLSLKTIKGNLETGLCLFVRNEGSFNTEADGYKQVRPERQQQSATDQVCSPSSHNIRTSSCCHRCSGWRSSVFCWFCGTLRRVCRQKWTMTEWRSRYEVDKLDFDGDWSTVNSSRVSPVFPLFLLFCLAPPMLFLHLQAGQMATIILVSRNVLRAEHPL